MPTLRIESGSVEETERLAARLARELEPGDVVLLSGELGAGKTTFVRGASRALGVTARVTSPTFTIGHRYPGVVDVSHLDLYRFRGLSAAASGHSTKTTAPSKYGSRSPHSAADTSTNR